MHKQMFKIYLKKKKKVDFFLFFFPPKGSIKPKGSGTVELVHLACSWVTDAVAWLKIISQDWLKG